MVCESAGKQLCDMNGAQAAFMPFDINVLAKNI